MIGNKIRNLRKNKNMTLSDLAGMTDLSVSYISQLERGMIEPSISSLRKISKALDTPLYLFMEEDGERTNMVVRSEDRINMSFPTGTINYEIASIMPRDEFSPNAMIMSFEIDPKGTDSDNLITHPSDEIVLVLEGELTATVGAEIITVGKGDTLYIKGNTPHKFTNLTVKKIKGYSVFSPPTWPTQK